MKPATKTVICAIGGIALGWSVAGVPRSSENPEESRSSKVENVAKRPRRPIPSPALLDVAACRALWESAAKPDGRHPLLRRLDRERTLRRWLELDAAGALAEAGKGLEEGFARELFRQWIELDAAAALSALNRSGEELVREVATDFFLNLLIKDPTLAAAELANPRWRDAKQDVVGWDFQRNVGEAWMRADPAAAIASLGAAGVQPQNTEYAFGIADAWAEMDFNAAWEHFFPDADLKKVGISELGPRMLGRGILAGSAEALELAGLAPTKIELFGPYSVDPLHHIADMMIRDIPRAALEWAEGRPEETRSG